MLCFMEWRQITGFCPVCWGSVCTTCYLKWTPLLSNLWLGCDLSSAACFTSRLSVERMLFCILHAKEMGAIFHPARLERLMTVDEEGKVFNKRGWGGIALRWKRREEKSIHAPHPSSVSSIVPPNRSQTRCLKEETECNIQICFPWWCS